jgi:hypothetical protein
VTEEPFQFLMSCCAYRKKAARLADAAGVDTSLAKNEIGIGDPAWR